VIKVTSAIKVTSVIKVTSLVKVTSAIKVISAVEVTSVVKATEVVNYIMFWGRVDTENVSEELLPDVTVTGKFLDGSFEEFNYS